jgi:hypothetical protein
MEKEHIDEILNKMFEIKEEKGEKIIIETKHILNRYK